MALINLRNALMAGGKPTAKDYVQSGLVAMWDGIENAGWGTHDVNATTWKDLVGEQYLLIPTTASFEAYYYLSTGTSPASTAGSNTLLENCSGFTVEAVLTLDASATTIINNSGGTGANNTASGFQVYTYNYNNRVSSRVAFGNGTTGKWEYTAPAPSDRLSVGVPVAVSTVINFQTGKTDTYHNAIVAVSSQNMSNKTIGYIINQTIRVMANKGKLFRAAIYSRALTADEIARNYAVDKARFGLP